MMDFVRNLNDWGCLQMRNEAQFTDLIQHEVGKPVGVHQLFSKSAYPMTYMHFGYLLRSTITPYRLAVA
jgi:hypothetical protein